MKKTLHLSAILTVLFLVYLSTSCTSGKKALEKGNYYDAVLKSVNRLRQNPTHKKASATLKDGYPIALEYFQEQIKMEVESNNQFRYGHVVSMMYSVNQMADEISRSPAAKKIIPSAKRYTNELIEAEGYAAEECYNAGLDALAFGTRDAAKSAYFYFKKSDGYVQGYKDVDQKIIEAKELATLRVVLEKVPVHSAKYHYSAEFFQDNVEAYLNEEFQRNGFIQLFTPLEAESIKLTPDHIIQIQFLDFQVGNTHTREVSKEITGADSVKIGDVKTKEGVQPAYGLPKATFTTFTKEVISKGVLELKILEFSSGKILMNRNIPGEYRWFTEWASFTGDKRALSEKQFELLRNRPSSPPNNQELFIEFTKPVFSQLQNDVKSFYSRY